MTCHTNPFSKDGFFELGEKIEKPTLPEDNMLPFASNRRAWDQYTNKFIYEFDSLVRQFIEQMSKTGRWKHTVKSRKYTMSMIYEHVYGRPYDVKKDHKHVNYAARILAYYSSRILKGTTINGKKYSKTIYVLSPRRLQKPPYSLRLRLEWLEDQGKLPTIDNMRLPQDTLRPGHARDGKVNARMQKRAEDGKRRYLK